MNWSIGEDPLDARHRRGVPDQIEADALVAGARSVMVKKSVLVFGRPSMISAALGISTPVKYMKSLFWTNSP